MKAITRAITTETITIITSGMIMRTVRTGFIWASAIGSTRIFITKTAAGNALIGIGVIAIPTTASKLASGTCFATRTGLLYWGQPTGWGSSSALKGAEGRAGLPLLWLKVVLRRVAAHARKQVYAKHFGNMD